MWQNGGLAVVCRFVFLKRRLHYCHILIYERRNSFAKFVCRTREGDSQVASLLGNETERDLNHGNRPNLSAYVLRSPSLVDESRVPVVIVIGSSTETWQLPKRYKSAPCRCRPFNTSISTQTRMYVVEGLRGPRRRFTTATPCSVMCSTRTTRLSDRWRLKGSKDCTRNTLTVDVN